jgi:plastocyanin
MKLSLPLAVCCAASAIAAGALFVGADESDAVPSPYTPAPATAPPANAEALPVPDVAAESPVAIPAGDIVIVDFAFSGEAVAAGAAVNVRNDDSAPHTVTGDGFDIEVGGGSSTTFSAPTARGNYSYTCLIHPTMAGSLVVQ